MSSFAVERYGFIEPDRTLETVKEVEIAQRLEIPIRSGHRASFSAYRNANPVFNNIMDRTVKFGLGYEDQCSSKYYWDLFNCVQWGKTKLTRLVDVGVFMGGSSVILAGCGYEFNLELDLLDIGARYLQFTYERIRRIYPEYVGKIRLYRGDLPTYVRDVLLKEQNLQAFLHHDASHQFDQVVRDLSSLFYVKEKINSIAIQDTNLRGQPDYNESGRFVDAAACAVFGLNVQYVPLGSVFTADNTLMTMPNKFQGNYCLVGAPEGWFIPMEKNVFKYPHPLAPPPLESFIDPRQR